MLGQLESLVVLFIALIVVYKLYKRLTRPKFNFYTTGEEVLKGIDLTDKIIIVTGANTGLGKETTRVLVKHNANVIMACRSDKKAKLAKQEIINTFDKLSQKSVESKLDCITLDLASLNSIYHFVKNFMSKYKKLDALINNAGVSSIPEYSETENGFEMQFGVNHVGPAYLTQLLTHFLVKSSPSRVIIVSSAFSGWGSPKPIDKYFHKLITEKRGPNKLEYSKQTNYAISKCCNILFAREYNRRHIINGVTAFSVHPGIIHTQIFRHGTTIEWIFVKILLLFMGKTVSQGVSTMLRCLQLSENEVKKYNGHFFMDCQSVEFSKLRSDHRVTNKKLINITKEFYDLTYELIKEKGFSLEIKL